MTIAALKGTCPTCGHDHDRENAEFLRALKREPNAAEESYESVHPKALDEPAPAAPESETPRTDALMDVTSPIGFKGQEMYDLARELEYGLKIQRELTSGAQARYALALERAEKAERRLSLAQTEIKGHMRTVDDLKVRIAELHHDNATLYHKYDHAQARIAELEKALDPFAKRAEYFDRVKPMRGGDWNNEDGYADDPPSDIYISQLRAARDALKSRA